MSKNAVWLPCWSGCPCLGSFLLPLSWYGPLLPVLPGTLTQLPVTRWPKQCAFYYCTQTMVWISIYTASVENGFVRHWENFCAVRKPAVNSLRRVDRQRHLWRHSVQRSGEHPQTIAVTDQLRSRTEEIINILRVEFIWGSMTCVCIDYCFLNKGRRKSLGIFLVEEERWLIFTHRKQYYGCWCTKRARTHAVISFTKFSRNITTVTKGGMIMKQVCLLYFGWFILTIEGTELLK